ncbi:MAG: Hsp20/alpha crystallin family protein [Dehalococcoidia bacterium]
MTSLIQREPIASLREMMDRMWEDELRPLALWRGLGDGGQVPLDMYQTENEVVVKATVPGVKPEDVDITIAGDVLTIKGESKVEEEKKEAEYFYRERRHGAFTRTVGLPSGLETDKAEATFEDGVLKLTIPKAEEVKPKKIDIKAKGS